MAKSRSHQPTSERTLGMHAFLDGGNGATPRETDTERLVRLEHLMERVQQTLETQFQRMADLQVQLDRLEFSRRRHS
jgi:hypothetical protein